MMESVAAAASPQEKDVFVWSELVPPNDATVSPGPPPPAGPPPTGK